MAAGSGLSHGTNGNIVGVDWKTVLENNGTIPTLANNGGPTLTHALIAGSPAINAGDDTLATDTGLAGGTPLATDQRGTEFDRIIAARSISERSKHR